MICSRPFFSSLFAGIVLGFSFLAACAPVSPTTADKGSSVDDADHKKIIRAFGGVYEDFKVGSYVAALSLKIAKASDNPTLNYRVTVLDSPQVNAFALPSGATYVTRGLLALANNEAEVAAVMGHEIAHVTARHGMDRQRTSIGTAVLANILGTVLNSRLANQIIDIGATGLIAGFSRQQEYEADEIGVLSLHRAGYDPYAGGDFLSAMGRLSRLEAQQNGGSRVPGWLSTHPDTGDRVSRAHKIADGLVTRSDWQRNRRRAAHLAAIDGMLYGDAPEEGYVRGQEFLHPVLRFRFSVPDGYALINTSQAVFAEGPQGGVIKFDTADVEEGMSLSSYLTNIWAKGLRLSDLREIEAHRPAVTAIHQGSGKRTRLGVLRAGEGRVYRFVLQSPVAVFAGLDEGFIKTIRSFRMLTASEAGQLKPLKIKILTVREGDSVRALAAQMRGVKRPEQMFRILNGLSDRQEPATGAKVKIITDSQMF